MDRGQCVEQSFEIENRFLWGGYDLGLHEGEIRSTGKPPNCN